MEIKLTNTRMWNNKGVRFIPLRNEMVTGTHNILVKGSIIINMTKDAEEKFKELSKANNIYGADRCFIDATGFISVMMINTIATPVLILKDIERVIPDAMFGGDKSAKRLQR